jgi:RNA polymerase sigma factor (sigma-70 family)
MQDVPAVAIGRIRHPARVLRLASDERLVALLRDGEERAFEAIYERHHRALLGFCRHMLGSQAEAEDAVQHTFLAAYRELVAHDRPIHLRAWLFTIARNRCLSLLRARREHVALDAAEPSTDGLAAAVQQREDVRELLGDLARLPEQQRAALLLSELGALDHEGVAAVLGCRREQVKALVFQARSSLAADREARATPCEQIRAELASARGAALRRGPLRRHLRDCAGCRAFGEEVARQRKLMAVALPVVPSVALKAAVLHGAGAAGGHAAAGGASVGAGTGTGVAASAGAATGAAGAASTGAGIAGLASTSAAKLAAIVAATGAIAGGSALAVHAVRSDQRPAAALPAPQVRTHEPVQRPASASRRATGHARTVPAAGGTPAGTAHASHRAAGGGPNASAGPARATGAAPRSSGRARAGASPAAPPHAHGRRAPGPAHAPRPHPPRPRPPRGVADPRGADSGAEPAPGAPQAGASTRRAAPATQPAHP